MGLNQVRTLHFTHYIRFIPFLTQLIMLAFAHFVQGPYQRYLWLQDRKGSLTDKEFFSTLIQFQPKPSQIRYLISHVVDTINGGIPTSSSLRTVAPLNGNCIVESTGNVVVRTIGTMGNKRLKTVLKPMPSWIVKKVQNIIFKYTNIGINAIQARGSSVFFNTACKACKIKSKMTKTDGAQHSKNVIYFILFGTLILHSFHFARI